MTLVLQDLPVEILRYIALNLEWFNLRFLIQAVPNGSVVFDAVFKCKFYSENYSDNTVGAALVAKEEDEYPYKLLLADINFWKLDQIANYDPSMYIPVDEALDICYAPIGIAINLVNEFIPCASLLVYQFHHTHTLPEYKQFLFDLDKVMTQNAARMGLYWPIVARVFVELMVSKCRDEQTAASDLLSLCCTMSDLDKFAIEPLVLRMISLPMQDYEEAFPSFYERLFEEYANDLCSNEICEATSQNCPGDAQDTIAKMKLFFKHLETDDPFEAGAFLANNIESDIGIVCEWLNDRFKAFDKIKWRKALLDVEDWNLDNARMNSRTQAVAHLFTDNEIHLWPLFDGYLSPDDNSDESIGILVTLLKAVILNGEKTKDEVEELLLEFMRENSGYKTVIKKIRRRLAEPDKDAIEHDDL